MIRLYMTTSLDGFVAGPDDRPGQELGRGGGRLFDWLDHRHGDGASGQIYREALATGVPIHVLTHHVDPADTSPGSARFFTDVTAAAEEARAAAGERAVMVHGAGAAQALLAAGLLDEIELHVVPVLLGAGRRLFGDTEAELELVRRLEDRDVLHLRYRVR
ncbi:dihydrofolate reductase family protein [Amycolatopsis vancoresmycina]|uniref:Putative dihydrofolate reductase n=1 Tax=Amycolatopsis vancoresmycina DSM 44592 TaxID=1292037 RepID=R1HMM2_9PSEU|nr:dihydrofolate reductase family protein [Amycolatopsis vancoresmycina]EOD64800.1 putative dihydrofolate reductase [Amycolatopsis vancoresmycina DSM 44592]